MSYTIFSKKIKLKHSEESQVFFSSDLHIDHKAICRGTSEWEDKSRCRNFDTLEDMNSHIINQINSTVSKQDTLILLGDTLFGDKKYGEFFNKLECENIYVLAGNHCNVNKLLKDEQEYKNYTYLGYYAEFIVNGQLVNVCHYPILSFNDMKKDSIMLYGHVHGSIQKSESKVAEYYRSLKTLDVGIDNAKHLLGEYIPFNFEWLQRLLQNKK